jgi:hypothetical protein
MITLEEINSKTREALLEWTLAELKNYKKENEEAVAEEYNFNHLPTDIEILLDAVFQSTYLPVFGRSPSSHYICHVNTMIESLEDRLSRIQTNKPLLTNVLADFSDSLETALLLIEEMGLPEVISQIGLSMIVDDELDAQEEGNIQKAINLIKKALEISLTEESGCPPKRYALLLAQLYCNAREDANEKVPVDRSMALDYLKQAASHGSATAKDLLETAQPIDELSQSNPLNQKPLPSLGGSRHILMSPPQLANDEENHSAQTVCDF